MKQGIVIVTCEKNKEFLPDCINSCMQDKYPILIVSNGNYLPHGDPKWKNVEIVKNDWNGFELGGIARGMERFDEFLLLQDTEIIKDQSIFDIIFNYDGTVYFTQDLAYHYCAKFRTEVLKQMDIPRVTTVREAIDNERAFGQRYLNQEWKKKMLIEPAVPCGVPWDQKVERHGRIGIIVSNQYIEKHKINY